MPNDNDNRLHRLRSRFTRNRRDGNTTPDSVMPEVEATRPCPFCKERVSRGATVCMYCERDIVAVMSPDAFSLKFGPRSNADDTESGSDMPD